jgi:iron complex transport system substrate-binding protein
MIGGNGHSTLLMFKHAPSRVVSLVPSITDSLFELGAGKAVVGVSEYCPIPSELEEKITRVGSTREPDVAKVHSLQPDLVLANQEENSKESIHALERLGLKVWLTFPRSTTEAIEVLWVIVKLFRLDPQAISKVQTLEVTLSWMDRAAHSQQLMRVFCPIWQESGRDGTLWWMTFNQDTYAHDLLRCCGGMNIFANRERRYPLQADLGRQEAEDPGDRDTRYPRVTMEEVLEHDPQVILLPSEPYPFGEQDVGEIRMRLAQTSAVREDRVRAVDGSLITWHGTRMAMALSELPDIFQV